MKHKSTKYLVLCILIAAITVCLLGLPVDRVQAGPPDPTPSPAMNIRTSLQPYQTPVVEPSRSDGRLLEGVSIPSEVEENPIDALDQQTFYCTADATVLQGYPSVNLGSTADMWAGYDECLDPPGQIARSLVRCDIASLPAHATIIEAGLRAYLVTSCDYPYASRTITAYSITSSWSESSVTWNNRPGYGASYGSTSIVHGDWDWYEFDVTGLVRAWYYGTHSNYGIMLRGPETSDSGWRGFGTREIGSTYRPRLVVEYGVTPPDIADLPDQTLNVNTSKNNAIDLWAYTSDAESPDSDLTFTIDNTPDPNAGVSIDSNDYIDINPAFCWTGQTDVVIRVTDPGGLSDTDTFRVTVTNSVPIITPLPDQTLPANSSLDNAIDLCAYTSDAESSCSDLSFTIDNTPDANAGVTIDSNRYVDINPAFCWTGQTDVVIRVADPCGLSDTDTFTVVVINSAPTITDLPDQSLEVNTSRDNAIDLCAYTSDPESPCSDLTFTIANTPDLNAGVTIDSNRYIDIHPASGWTGQTDVVIRVTDPCGLSSTDTFSVTVATTNSAPSIIGLPDRTLLANTSLDNAIDLWAYASDAESPDSQLTFTIDNTPDPNAGVTIDSNRYIDIHPTSGWTGQTDVVIRVTDPYSLSGTDTFLVEVTLRKIYLPIVVRLW